MTKFKDITQAMLEEFEREYFDVLDVPAMRGVHRNASGNIKAAVDAGWVDAPNGLGPLERIQLSNDIDEKYKEFTVIDPNG